MVPTVLVPLHCNGHHTYLGDTHAGSPREGTVYLWKKWEEKKDKTNGKRGGLESESSEETRDCRGTEEGLCGGFEEVSYCF